MPDEEPKKYSKPKVICPFCQERQPNGNFRAFAVNGMSMHVRMQHPDKYDEYQTHRDKYIKRFACDNEGNLIGENSEPVPKIKPEIVEEEVISEQTYVELEEPKEIEKPTPTPPPVKIPVKQVPKKTPVKKPKPIPEEPMQEEFPDDREPERSVYNPYGFTD